MGMMYTWAAELPPFHENMDHKLKQQKTNYFNSTSTTKAVPLQELYKELFSPTDQDNKYSTQMLEYIGVVSATRWLQELLDPNKASYTLISESGVECSWVVFPDELREALLGFMAVNNIAENSFCGMTDQLQVFGRIEMASASDISNIARNGFLDRPTTNNQMSDKKTSMFHDFPEQLQITDIMCALKEAPDIGQSNIDDMDRQRNTKQERCKLVNQEGLQK